MISTASRPILFAAGRYNVRVIMAEAVRQARLDFFGSWALRMGRNLRLVWAAAKRQAATHNLTGGQVSAPKLSLDRAAAFRLLARIKAHASNRARDFLSLADRLPDLAAVLAFARAEFAALPAADRPAMLLGLGQPAPVAIPVRSPVLHRNGARAAVHGW